METSSSSGKNSSSKSSPWLSFEAGARLWQDFGQSERQEIVRHYSPKIKLLALRLKAKLPPSVELGELLSAGALGLMEALGRYKPELGIKFETFAESRIKGAMLDELRKLDWFSRGQRHRVRIIDDAMRRMEAASDKTPSAESLAQATGLTVKEVNQAMEAMQSQLCLSLDAISENLTSFKQQQIDNEPYKSAALKEIVDKLALLIDELTPREQLVLSLYYVEELNMRETSEVMGITEGRVSQLHSQALAKLRGKFHAQYGIVDA
ncbi:RNA polymerase sigma factor FliA [Fundidesulfovibrio magnetotacticus]|uniref:RNA polymerase sigma factor n=1 Tax=Fundidesulfovibrio magnetotacticus TaxID=2730080 RepID=A0A6V8LRX8_9BACT|nr:FliA/WhiG family RNA polymerase sigma factor [Fundidesulfovibrio magnetotacticus]GFK92546.1 RNA polymerase sigma factor FliA [Fundidesulfovibrio magnetotacticus]